MTYSFTSIQSNSFKVKNTTAFKTICNKYGINFFIQDDVVSFNASDDEGFSLVGYYAYSGQHSPPIPEKFPH